jgi:hypothetical protein
MTGMERGNRGSFRRCAAVLVLCVIAGCWESVGNGTGGDDTDADGSAEEETDSLAGWSCSDLSPCVYSDVSGYTCPGFAVDVKCWNLGAYCDAVYLCANASQACEIGCAALECEESAAIPPQPLCPN